jgi:ABC-type lipoprotein export system ATPase subunit
MNSVDEFALVSQHHPNHDCSYATKLATSSVDVGRDRSFVPSASGGANQQSAITRAAASQHHPYSRR